MEYQLLNGFNNGRDTTDGVGGQEPFKLQYIDESKKLQLRHEEIKSEMLKIIDAVNTLENQYKNLENELYDIEKKYMDNLRNVI